MTTKKTAAKKSVTKKKGPYIILPQNYYVSCFEEELEEMVEDTGWDEGQLLDVFVKVKTVRVKFGKVTLEEIK